MKILKTKNIDFCSGIKHAHKMVFKEAAAKNMAYTVGPIIHNPQMLNILKEKTVIPVNNVFQIKNDRIAFLTRRVKKDREEYIKETIVRTIDTACPFVKRVRKMLCI